MDKFVIKGGKKLSGTIAVSGSKNVALKTLVAAALTEDEVTIKNIPLISDFFSMVNIVKELGGECDIYNHTLKVRISRVKKTKIPLEMGAKSRTSSMFLAPLLQRAGMALIPNPGGCRIGARPIDRHIEGLQKMGAKISYLSADGYFHASCDKLRGITYRFKKNTHTGTETLLLAAVLALGKTVLQNASAEPEVDDLIRLLNAMGAKIRRVKPRTIIIEGVNKLHGTKFEIMPDRNEIVTFGAAAIITGGNIFINNAKKEFILSFLDKLSKAGAGWKEEKGGIRFYKTGKLINTDVVTSPHPAFMTDWQGPWAVMMTGASGESFIHETVYENRFSYVEELKKMGAKITLYNPKVEDPEHFYNFNWKDNQPEYFHAAKIKGPSKLHNAVLTISDLRAGATLVLAALKAKGESVIYGVEHIDRGYEDFEGRLRQLGADIKRVKE